MRPDANSRITQRELVITSSCASASPGLFVLCCLLRCCCARFVYLQVVQHDYYRTKAEDNRISIVPIVPNRGLILDRNGVVLARNYSAYTLEITPGKVTDLEKTIDELADGRRNPAARPHAASSAC